MKKYVGAIIGALIIVLAFAMFWTNGTHDRATRKQKLEDYEKLMSLDVVANYPQNPTEVVKLYCDIERLIYSFDFTNEDEDIVGNLVELQCKLYDEELIDYNGGVSFIKLNAQKQVTDFLEKGYKLIETKLQTSSTINADDNGNVLKYVNVIQYVNKGENSYKMYCLRQDGKGKWKILTFADIDKFSIS